MNRPRPWRVRLDPSNFGPRESWLLRSAVYTISLFRYDSGVGAARISCGRGEMVWLPFLGQQLWDWKIDGRSRKFSGFVDAPAFGRSFLQNYGAFLVHCGMSAMGNPGQGDTHPQHGELPTAKFDRAWLEIDASHGGESLALCGSLHWHVPYESDYRCVIRTFIDPSGTMARVEIALKNESRTPMELMYLAHINWSLPEASLIRGAEGLAHRAIRIRNEDANPGARAQILAGALDPASLRAAPEFVATIDHGGGPPRTLRSELELADGSTFWVEQGGFPLDHHVIWVTNTPDRGACGFHLPCTAGPDGLAAARAAGEVKVLPPSETARMSYSFGYTDAEHIREEKQHGEEDRDSRK